MNLFLDYLRRYRSRQYVRPWALATPILVLVLALPMLRPLRCPEPEDISNNELSRLAAVQAMGESGTQVIDQTSFFQALRQKNPRDPIPPNTVKIESRFIGDAPHFYSDQPPVMAAVLAGIYRLLRHTGLTFAVYPTQVAFLLTLLGTTLPVAGVAGLIYRMGRLFELARPRRTALAAIVVLGSGLITYAVALNSNAPAAALVLCACGCIIHLVASRKPPRMGIWIMLCGFCAALAAVIDLGAGFFLVGMVFVILTMRWPKSQRLGALFLYVLGALPPLLFHLSLTMPITGDWRPPLLHGEFYRSQVHAPAAAAVPATDDEAAPSPGWLRLAGTMSLQGFAALFGSHGILSHFPVVLVGLAGLGMVLHRHWPTTTKALAWMTVLGSLAVVVTYIALHVDWTQAMYGPRWFILFLPLVLFWSGVWLRKSHKPVTWAGAGLLLAFSVAVSLLGMTDPFIATAPGRYTAAAAAKELLSPTPRTSTHVMASH